MDVRTKIDRGRRTDRGSPYVLPHFGVPLGDGFFMQANGLLHFPKLFAVFAIWIVAIRRAVRHRLVMH